MVHGYNIDSWISIRAFSINGLFGMDISRTLQLGFGLDSLCSYHRLENISIKRSRPKGKRTSQSAGMIT